VEPWFELLRRGAPEQRADAAIALGATEDKKAVGQLVSALRDPVADVRAAVCDALGEIGDPRAVPPLVSLLRDDDDDVRGEAFSALLRIGQARAGHLPVEAFTHEDPRNPSVALTQIVWPADLEAVSLLATATDDADAEVRIGAAYTLGRLGITSIYERVAQMLESDPDPDARAAAAFAMGDLGEAGDRRAMPALVNAWHHVGDDHELAVLVVRALSGLVESAPRRGDDAGPTFQVFAHALRHPDDRVRQLAAMGLARTGDPSAVSALSRALRDAHAGVRRNAAAALGRLGDPTAIQALVRAVPGEGADVRDAIGQALARIDRNAVLTVLYATLQSPEAAHRQAATYLLGHTGDPAGLEAAAADPDSEVRKTAVLAMARCAEPTLRPHLEAALDDEEWKVRVAAAEGLRRLGDPTARGALERHREDVHHVVRNAVGVALRSLEG